jgi:hypothetical protein
MTNALTSRIIVSEKGTDLSGRAVGRALRAEVERHAFEGHLIELDFAGVRCTSDSFLDELFAVLVVVKGANWFRSHVRVTNADEATLADIVAAVRRRVPPRVSDSATPAPC